MSEDARPQPFEDFIEKTEREVAAFRAFWTAKNTEDQEAFPMSLLGGDWWEQLQTFVSYEDVDYWFRVSQRQQRMNGQITTVGQLRAALAGIPDDRPLWAQVAAKDGSAWMMAVKFSATIAPSCSASLLTLCHPALETMPTDVKWSERP